MSRARSKRKPSVLEQLFGPADEQKAEAPPPEPVFQPAMKQLGTTRCPVCHREVAVFLTKTRRPFLNCSFCSVRIFYNGQESMRRLRKNMKPIEEE